MKHILSLITAACLALLPLAAAETQVITVGTASSQLLLQVGQNGVVRTVHYGSRIADPGQFAAYRSGRSTDYGVGAMAYPTAGGRNLGVPALSVRYGDGYRNTELYYSGHDVAERSGITTTTVRLEDPVTKLRVALVYDAYNQEDVILAHAEIANGGSDSVSLVAYASSALYLDGRQFLLTHFHGDWADEMKIDRELLGHDVKVIESRRGTQVTQHNNPSFLLSLDTDRFDEDHGEVIAGALAWSGNFRISFERDETGRLSVVSGINPEQSEVVLSPGERFVTPEMVWTWSGTGAGGASRNLHAWARHYGVYHGGEVHPTLLNSWEGAYFNFTTPTLLGMIDDAAALGLEMFVLDDGWFGTEYPRNGDGAGLGDWEPNLRKIPEGIDYVASYAHSKGLKFGIWIEPEMVNPESRLAREHPDWVVQSRGRDIPQTRHQWVLDLSNPAVQDFVFGVFDGVMQLSKNIDYVKWDCNRTVASFGSPWLGTEQNRFFVEYVQGFYRVMERIRAKYPDVLVQCCSSGGGRVDYGALRYFDEIWPSDNTDAYTRARIQYATNLIYPACISASHVSAVPNHQTGNVTSLKFRFDMACAGRLGMELQPKSLNERERAFAERAIRSYKEYRDLVFTGEQYRLASPLDGPFYALMYVSADRRRAVVFTYCLQYQNREVGGKAFLLKGLAPEHRYRVRELNVDKSCWWGDGGVFGGDFLRSGGFNPVLESSCSSAVFYLEAE